MSETNKTWTVSEVNRLIKEVLDQTFYPFRVRGEVSNLTIHRSGHVYFSLKDARSQIAAVFFRGASAALELGLKNGLEVDVDGRVSVYEVRGTCQILVSQIIPLGTGELRRRFEELKEKLQSEGLFDSRRKRPIPQFPRAVGVITSTQGAAIRDFCHILERRFADLHVRIFPAAVQGEKAAREIAAGIEFFNRSGDCDVIVITRGGGSLEDLWPFNEEMVARTVAASNLPVISAVGHEIDYTICDFVADLRVPTPSAAAELVVQEKSRLREQVAGARDRIVRAARLQFSEWRRRLERAAGADALREPINLVRQMQQRIDEAGMRMQHAVDNTISQNRRQLQWLNGRLQALSPQQVLERGYAVLTDQQGHTIKDTAKASLRQSLLATLAKGRLELTVEKIERSKMP